MSDQKEPDSFITHQQADMLSDVVCRMAVDGKTSSEINLSRASVLHNFRKINEARPKLVPCVIGTIRAPESWLSRFIRWIVGGRHA